MNYEIKLKNKINKTQENTRNNMPGDLIFAIIMLIACLGMMSWMSYEFFTKIKNKNLYGGLVFWIVIFFFGVVICSGRIVMWY